MKSAKTIGVLSARHVKVYSARNGVSVHLTKPSKNKIPFKVGLKYKFEVIYAHLFTG